MLAFTEAIAMKTNPFLPWKASIRLAAAALLVSALPARAEEPSLQDLLRDGLVAGAHPIRQVAKHFAGEDHREREVDFLRAALFGDGADGYAARCAGEGGFSCHFDSRFCFAAGWRGGLVMRGCQSSRLS